MPVKIVWKNGGWSVNIGNSLCIDVANYREAFFWKKYQNEIDIDFLTDYLNNS